MRFGTGYMDTALFDLPAVIETATSDLDGVDFDTLVGTGFSGGVVVPTLALALGKKFVLVRKPNDDSHHSGKLIGEFGDRARWLFVDDFICGGTTKRRVIEQIALTVKTRRGSPFWADADDPDPTYVGDYLYNYSDDDWDSENVVCNKHRRLRLVADQG